MPNAPEKFAHGIFRVLGFAQGFKANEYTKSSYSTEIHKKILVTSGDFILSDRESVTAFGGGCFISVFFNT